MVKKVHLENSTDNLEISFQGYGYGRMILEQHSFPMRNSRFWVYTLNPKPPHSRTSLWLPQGRGKQSVCNGISNTVGFFEKGCKGSS